MQTNWESDVATLLSDISAVQADTLELLTQKRHMLAETDLEGLASLATKEDAVVERLQQCLARREEFLSRARREGRPHQSIRELTRSLPRNRREPLLERVDQAQSQARILAHESLTNWVIVQKTLIHLSQMLEIIATGGRPEPTYKREASGHTGGSLVDQEA